MNIVTLTLAPAFDIHCDAESILVDHENIASVTDYDAGGKGVNISRALVNVGCDNTAIVAIGNENGLEFEKRLKNDNICFQKIDISGRIRENITIHTANGRETRLSFKGAVAPFDLLKRVEAITDKICDSETILTFTGRLPEGVSVSDAKSYLSSLKKRGTRIVLDSRSFSLGDMLEVKPFLIKPNEEEISMYMGRDITDMDSASLCAKELYEKGIENVMISLGEKGAVLCSGGEIFTSPAPSVNVISTIGAGDSSIAGFLYALSKGKSAYDCLRYAVAFGSAACELPGTNPPKADAIERFLSEI